LATATPLDGEASEGRAPHKLRRNIWGPEAQSGENHRGGDGEVWKGNCCFTRFPGVAEASFSEALCSASPLRARCRFRPMLPRLSLASLPWPARLPTCSPGSSPRTSRLLFAAGPRVTLARPQQLADSAPLPTRPKVGKCGGPDWAPHGLAGPNSTAHSWWSSHPQTLAEIVEEAGQSVAHLSQAL